MVLGLSVVISASLPDRTSFLRERERGDGRGGRREGGIEGGIEGGREGEREGGRERIRHLFTVHVVTLDYMCILQC